MSYDDKREKINQLYNYFFGVPFFSYRDSSLKQSAAPVIYSGPKTGIATARSPGKTKQPNQTNPFAPNGTKVQGLAPYGMMPAAIPQQQTAYTTTGGKKKNKTSRRKRNQRKKRTSTSKRRA